MQKSLHLSVHNVVDMLLRQGSIDNRVFTSSTMQEGTRLHSLFQNEQNQNYQSEVYLAATFVIDDVNFFVEGRADGVITGPDGVTVDEIKTTVADLQDFYEENKEWHLGQAKFYAYIYAVDHGLDRIKVRLTYISQNDYLLQKRYYFEYEQSELTKYVSDLMDRYYTYLKTYLIHREQLAASLQDFTFPYPAYRAGQDQMIEMLETACAEHSFAFVEAPTGIGKTAASLYPFVKGLAGEGEKVFYLTSKNSIKKIALDTIRYFQAHRALVKGLIVSSKESLCINDKKRRCNPDECPFAKDYYKKINTLLYKVFAERDLIDYEALLEIGAAHEVCPFEFQLDLAVYYDVIIADYNHLFHPTSHLIRFFDSGPRPYYLLVDECHNLPGRVRDMHSGSISGFRLFRLLKALSGKTTLKLRKRIKALLDYFKELVPADYGDNYDARNQIVAVGGCPEELIDLIEKFDKTAKDYLKEPSAEVSDELLEVYYELHSFLDLPAESDSYAYYFRLRNDRADQFYAACLDSRCFINPAKRLFLAGAFFSATLAPQDFYLDLLGCDDGRKSLMLPSPFPPENFKVLVDPLISTRYRDRSSTLIFLLEAIKAFVLAKTGNYFVFFPSYQYMTQIVELFGASTAGVDIFVQTNQMDYTSREEFLARFRRNPSRTTVGFVVMGGVFAEGIDLLDDRLIGAAVVGVGLPSICYENDLLRGYYGQDDPDRGYDYAYLYPGINKVLQAAGRVIRSEADRGVLLLIDQRYQEGRYRDVFEPRFENLEYVFSDGDIKKAVRRFWEESK